MNSIDPTEFLQSIFDDNLKVGKKRKRNQILIRFISTSTSYKSDFHSNYRCRFMTTSLHMEECLYPLVNFAFYRDYLTKIVLFRNALTRIARFYRDSSTKITFSSDLVTKIALFKLFFDETRVFEGFLTKLVGFLDLLLKFPLFLSFFSFFVIHIRN